jgi:glycosyltransferase involved in cell wall biosynthesis
MQSFFITKEEMSTRIEMKLAVFVEFFPPNFGSDRRIYEIMTRLSKKHEIHFLVFPSFRMLSGKISSPQDRLHLQGREIITKEKDITAHYIPVSVLLVKLWVKFYPLAYVLTMFSLFFKALKSLKKTDPATVVLNYPSVYTGVLGCITGKRLLRRRVLLDFNDLIAQYTSHLLNLRPQNIMAKLSVLVQDSIVRSSDKIIAPTSCIKEYASRLGVKDEKITVIPNGVDTNFFDPRKYVEQIESHMRLNGRKICMYCGRLDSWAGTDIILQLSKACAKKSQNTSFVIVGSGEEKVHPAENIVAVGRVAYEEVPKMLAVADVVLVPFPDNEVSRAASPLKLFEGMAMGKAIVASDVDGIKEVLSHRENGMLVGPSDIAEWNKAVTELLNDGSMATRLGENARILAKERYDWGRLAAKYERILTE